MRLTCFLLLGLLSPMSVHASDLDARLAACFALAPKKLSRCLDRTLSERPSPSVLDAVAARLAIDAESAIAVLDWFDRRRTGSSDEVRARKLDLEGQALLATGRLEESADAFFESVSTDPGTTRVTFLPAGEGRSWSVEIGEGNGRLERAIRSLERAGRTERAEELSRRWAALGVGSAASPAQGPHLEGYRWFKPLPEIDVELLDGTTFSFAEHRGHVLILDFWATWCEPCVRELPRLQELWEQERDNGLIVLAINSEEPDDLVQRFVRELELTMPVGKYRRKMRRPFLVNSLPTVVVADRGGRIRGRWDGYADGQEEDITEFARWLMEDGEHPERESVGRVVQGAGLFEVLWVRDTPSSVEGLTVVAEPQGPAAILVSYGRSLARYGRLGQTEREWRGSRAAGELAAGPRDAQGRFRLIGFRRGATGLVDFDMPDGSFVERAASAPVLDVAVVARDASTPVASDLLVATTGGLAHESSPGTFSNVGDFGLTSDLLAVDDGVVALVHGDSGTRVVRLDSSMRTVRQTGGPTSGWMLASGPAGDLVVPADIVSIVRGNFLGHGTQAALATRSGMLHVIDLESGETAFRLHWEGISRLAAGDIDGDGRDDLVVSDTDRLAVLRGVQTVSGSDESGP